MDNQFFNVIRVHRDDLVGYLGKEKAAALTDDEMENIASRLSDGIMETGAFWEGVEQVSELLKQEA